MVAAGFGQYKANHSDLAYPWESGVLADTFGSGQSLSLRQCAGYSDRVLIESSATREHAMLPDGSDVLPHDAKYTSAVQSLTDVPCFENKAHKLELACGLWMDILATDWNSSEAGSQLAPALLRDSG